MDSFERRERVLDAAERKDVGGMAEFFMNKGVAKKVKNSSKSKKTVANDIPKSGYERSRGISERIIEAGESGLAVNPDTLRDVFGYERDPF